MQRYYLCRRDEISDRQCKEFAIKDSSPPIELFLVQKDNHVYAYQNHCPHTGINLNWQPNQFFDITGQLLQCSTHGALFRIHDGLCVRGPCNGASLTPLTLSYEQHDIYLEL